MELSWSAVMPSVQPLRCALHDVLVQMGCAIARLF